MYTVYSVLYTKNKVRVKEYKTFLDEDTKVNSLAKKLMELNIPATEELLNMPDQELYGLAEEVMSILKVDVGGPSWYIEDEIQERYEKLKRVYEKREGEKRNV